VAALAARFARQRGAHVPAMASWPYQREHRRPITNGTPMSTRFAFEALLRNSTSLSGRRNGLFYDLNASFLTALYDGQLFPWGPDQLFLDHLLDQSDPDQIASGQILPDQALAGGRSLGRHSGKDGEDHGSGGQQFNH
jgi:hypothetical protein